MTLKGKVALVTGGSKGIGYGIARALLEQGMHVVITSRTQQTASDAADRLISETGGRAIGLECDVRNYASQEMATAKTIAEFGGLDVLVANAGVGHFAPIESIEIEKWHEVIDTNLTGVFYSVKASLPALKKSKGYIITISSLAGANFFPSGSAYNASKFGLTGFTQSIMLDLGNYGIKVSTIMPGSVASHFNDHLPNEKDAWKIQPDDIGQMVRDLLLMNPRTLPSKIEVRPSVTSSK